MSASATTQSTSLSGKQRRYLRALGHHAKGIVQLGKSGVDEAQIAALSRALLEHELVKVKFGQNCEVERSEAIPQLATATGSQNVQVLGHTALFYKPHPKKPKIVLPRAKTNAGDDTDNADDEAE